MKYLLTLALSVLTVAGAHDPYLQTYEWLACATNGKSVPVYLHAGDLMTLDLPRGNDRPAYAAFFTTEREPSNLGDLRGKTITARFRVEAAPGTVYGVGFGAGPATARLYFTTTTGPFNFNDSDNRHPSNYWWNGPSAITFDAADGFTDVTITASVTDTGGWTDSHGQFTPATFNAAASQVRQIGFAFGGSSFFDTGVSGAATLHLWSFTVQ